MTNVSSWYGDYWAVNYPSYWPEWQQRNYTLTVAQPVYDCRTPRQKFVEETVVKLLPLVLHTADPAGEAVRMSEALYDRMYPPLAPQEGDATARK